MAFKLYLFIIVLATLSFYSVISKKVFSKDELSKYNGKDPSVPIYLAIKGVVFDVSTGRDFYGPNGSYGIMAGKDCTRAIAKWSIKEEDLNNPNLNDLTDKELASLEDTFKKVYTSKYPVVGYMTYYTGNQEL